MTNVNDSHKAQSESLERLDPSEDAFFATGIMRYSTMIGENIYPEGHLDKPIANYKKKWESLRSREVFSTREQEFVTLALGRIVDYRETQVKDRGAAFDPALPNYMRAKRVLLSWEESCKQGSPKLLALEPEGELSQQIRDDILDGYVKRSVNNDPKEYSK